MYTDLVRRLSLVQLASIFTALELRTTVAHGTTIAPGEVAVELNKYSDDSTTTANWDAMQRDLHCCGGINFNTGFRDYA